MNVDCFAAVWRIPSVKMNSKKEKKEMYIMINILQMSNCKEVDIVNC